MLSARFLRIGLCLVTCAAVLLALSEGSVQSQDKSEIEDANAILQAVGGLGIGHIQSSLGMIGVTADAFAKDVYTPKQVEDLMNGTINGIESVKKLLRRLQDNELTDDDKEYIDRMINVYNALQREAKMLVVFSKSKKPADAEQFDTARKSAVLKLAQLTEGDKIPVAVPTDKTEED